MPDSSKARSSSGVKSHNAGRPGGGRWRAIWPPIFALLFIIGGIEALALGVVRLQDANRLAAAPLCASGQQDGCRLDERVTIVDLNTDYSARNGPVKTVKVRTPDDNTQIVYATDHDAGLWSRLQVSEAVNAELWNGFVIRLDDGAGHYLVADDSPAVTSVLFPIIGILAVIGGGVIIAFYVRRMRRPVR